MNALSLVTPVVVALAASSRTFDVLVYRLAAVIAGLEGLAKRATRKGLGAPVLWTVGKAYTKKEGCENVTRVPVTLIGENPCYQGWTFVAALEHLDGDNIVRGVPGEDVPREYRNSGPKCDHCKHDRRRNDTYVLRHGDGRFVQVGSTCIRDFLGSVDADKLAASATLLAQARSLCEDDYSEGFGGGPTYLSLDSYLPIVAWCVQAPGYGWTSRTKAREEGGKATADTAWNFRTDARAYKLAGVNVTDAHIALANAAESWAENLTDAQVDAEKGDYLHNLRTVARSGLVSCKHAGIAASAVTAYQRYIARERQGTERAARPESTHVGTVGKRETFKGVKLDFVTGYQTEYGYTTVLKFVTESGAVLVWKASNTDLTREDVGKVYNVTGSVKAHDEYKGAKQTMITRCKIG